MKSPLLIALLLISGGLTMMVLEPDGDESSAASRPPFGFEPPGESERLRAIGPVDGLAPGLRRAFGPSDDFAPIPAPGPSDWLATHHEPGQTFTQFVASEPNRPDARRSKLYFLPLGDFDKDVSPELKDLEAFAEAFFGLPVEFLDRVPLEGTTLTHRINSFTRKRQYRTRDILRMLPRKLPKDGYCLLAFTMEDLYPDESWNFVFGQATLKKRVGVYSFARYDPAFYGRPRDGGYRKLILQRSCHVLAHETSHMFGMRHCIYFSCLANGSNNLEESDSRPLRLCPACLRKLQWSTGFDVVRRYEKLHRFYRRVGFAAPAEWVSRRLKRLATGEGAR